MTNLDSVFKAETSLCWQRSHMVKTMVSPVVMFRCESWTLNKSECWRTDAFELWFWGKHFKSSLDGKEIKPFYPKGNQPWKFIGRTAAKAEALILWPPDAKSQLLGKDLDAGKDWRQARVEGGRGWDCWMASLAQWTWIVKDREAWHAIVHGIQKSQTLLNDWTRTADSLHCITESNIVKQLYFIIFF